MTALHAGDAPTVVVVGSVNRDYVVRVPRLPAPGETVVGGKYSEGLGGKGANQAVAAARLGARVALVAAVGKDPAGETALEDLAAHGVDTRFVSLEDASTGVAMIVVDDAGENQIAVASGANARLSAEAVSAAVLAAGNRSTVVLANLEVPDEAVLAAAESAASRGYRFVLNPAPARPLPDRVFALCDVLTPNEHELRELTAPVGSTPEQLLTAGARAIVVTRGAAGADVYRSHERPHHQPAAPASVIDTTGAGDAFSAALALAIALGESLESAVRWGAAAGALATEAVGAQSSLPDRGSVEARLRIMPKGTSQPPALNRSPGE